MPQTTSHILMVRPAAFGFNPETALSNTFQNQIADLSQAETVRKAQAEFDGFVALLRQKGVQVMVIEDTPEPIKPDAVFPNNWISMHPDGTVYLYPMCTPNRRLERRREIVAQLSTQFDIKTIKDWGHFEENNQILEGTGSMVLDHTHKVVYACLSPRTDKELLMKYAADIGYEAIVFTSTDQNGTEVYHTNVVMCVGEGFVVICLDSIANAEERKTVVERFGRDGMEIVDISLEQMNQFAGNMLQVQTASGSKLLVMSQTAYSALSATQVARLNAHTEILAVPIPTIETIGGGSARCMMAEIFCPVKG